MIAKVDPSKSAVGGKNQLILVQAPYFYVENEFGTNFFMQTGQLFPTGILFSAGNS